MNEEQMDQIARLLYEIAMEGARAPMSKARVSFDNADRVADGIYARFRRYVEEHPERFEGFLAVEGVR